VLVTTKPPTWRDNLAEWRERPLTLGQPHEGFLYPDPLGFWAEVRRWVTDLLADDDPTFSASEALAVSALVHVGDSPGALALARSTCRPAVVLFLDEPAWQASGWQASGVQPHHVPDPHRDGQVYQGFWGRLADGLVVGKAPQHPSMHRFYRREDMREFLRSAPLGD
jgi:hypothetical protein